MAPKKPAACQMAGRPQEEQSRDLRFAWGRLAPRPDQPVQGAGGLTGSPTGDKPGKSIFEVEAPSVKKKLKDKAFARSVSRDHITNGADG